MKKLLLTFLLIIGLILIGCSNSNTGSTTSEKSSVQNDDQKDMGETDEKDNSAPLIDVNNPLDERAELEEAVIRQKDILKLSFITDNYRNIDIHMSYYPMDDEFTYGASYTYPHIISHISFEGGTTSLTSDSFFLDSSNGEKLNHDSFDALFGAYEFEGEDTYYITGEDTNGVSYIVRTGHSEEGYTNQILELMGQSMKTEEDGAYDPFYKLFALDLEKLKFPKVNQKRTDIYAAGLSFHEGSIGSSVGITYLTGDGDQITYTIKDQESLWESDNVYEKINEEKTDGGYHVTEFSGMSEDDRYFYWTDGEYYYELTSTSYNKDTIVTEDIYSLIDSAMNDDRQFENKEVFGIVNEKPRFTENEEKLNGLIETLEDPY